MSVGPKNPGDDYRTALSGGDSPTLTRPTAGEPPSLSSADTSSRRAAPGRFPPGEIVAGRYRVIELLGRGGMGEVYRADDLTLDQCVAVKFLAAAQIGDATSMADMQREVRIARQITHPNVCRVHDLGVWQDRPFITMEYIDGEPLNLLLRRIGRLAPDKALDIAQQLCVALAAAHDQGILHRDLKPSNVMIDGRGKVRITDFGLAGVATQIGRDDIRAGTPAYMAPEQLDGREVTVRSDIYALGLVLYEVFTGKRATPGETLAEISRWHTSTSSTPTLPSRIVGGLDEAIERIILRCIERDPARRPTSAKGVLAALPGFDPLAAAIAAGETPSPELVAAAGPRGGLAPVVAVALLAITLLGMALLGRLSAPHSLLEYVRLEKPPAVLVDRAREMLTRFGLTDAPADSAWGFQFDNTLVTRLRTTDRSPQRWEPLRRGEPPTIRFWYRQAPFPLAANSISGRITESDPPLVEPGQVCVVLSPMGRLVAFDAIPSRGVPEASQPSDVNWSPLFESAGLNFADFRPGPPRWNPRSFADARGSWVGHYAESPDQPIYVEAAALYGKPVHFRVLPAWDLPATSRPVVAQSEDSVVARVNAVLLIICGVGAGLLAWRNLSLGRGDVKGAKRFAWFVLVISMAAWLISCDHVATMRGEMFALYRALGVAVFRAGLSWLLYLALEPTIRKRWPDALISWTRLLGGRLSDPTVGRDVLIGTAFAVLGTLIAVVRPYLAYWIDGVILEPVAPNPDVLFDWRASLGVMVDGVSWALTSPMVFLLLLVLLLVVVRSRTAAVAVLSLVAAALAVTISTADTESFMATAITAILTVALYIVALIRFGLLALVAMQYAQIILGYFLMRVDFSAWYAPQMLLAAAILLAIATAAFRTSLAGRSIFDPKLLDE